MMFAGLEMWWSWPESNRRPPACKTGALPIELQPPCEGKPDAGRARSSNRSPEKEWWA
jgi:hypothetical protein